MNKEKIGTSLWRKIGWMAGGTTAVLALIMTLLGLFGGQIFASKEALLTLETKVETQYVTKEVIKLQLEPMQAMQKSHARKLDKIYDLLLAMKRGK